MNRKGQALVEFVLILPIFLLILFAIVDLGMILNKKNELENISVDVVSMIKNNDNVNEINNLYPDLTIEVKEEGEYIRVIIYDNIDIMTPGLNHILGDPYKVQLERIIPNA